MLSHSMGFRSFLSSYVTVFIPYGEKRTSRRNAKKLQLERLDEINTYKAYCMERVD